MNNSVKKIATGILAVAVLTSSFSVAASKHSGQSSGVIRFTGMIVASPCVIETNTNKIMTKCWDDKGSTKTISDNIQRLKEGEVLLPYQKGTQEFSWINKDKTLGIYTIKYD